MKNNILPFRRTALYYIAAFIWGVPGVILTVKGIQAYCQVPGHELWWLPLITAAVLVGFFFMFRKVVDKYSKKIAELPGKASVLHTFPLRGWILIAFMMALGMTLKRIPGIPTEFTASFYCGLGPVLLWSAWRFIRNSLKN